MSAYVDEAVTLGMDMVLDAVSGSTWQDGTANSLDATVVGATSATGPGDGLTTAVSFDGVDDYAEIGDNAAFRWNGDNSFSFGGWVKRTGTPTPDEWNSVLGAGFTAASTDSPVTIRNTGNGGADELEANASWMTVGRGKISLTLDAWYFVMLTCDGSTVRIYVGDLATSPTQKDSASTSNGDTTDAGFLIGAERYQGALRRWYPAEVAGPVVGPTALSLANIEALYDATFVAGGATLAPASATHGHTAAAAELTQAHTLAPDSASHGHTADASSFTTSQAVPTGLNVVSKTSTSVTVGWDAVTGVDAYDIDRDLVVVATDVTATQYEDTELDPSTEYSYRVRSVVHS